MIILFLWTQGELCEKQKRSRGGLCLIFSGFNESLIKKLINMSRGSEGVCVMMSQGILREATLLQLKQYSAARKEIQCMS
jgi:hypothetical protein